MPASVTDKFRKTAPAFSTTLASQKASGATTMSLSSATGVPTDTAIDFTVGRVDSSGTRTPSAKAVYKGTLSGTTVSNLTLVEGTDQLHAAGTPVEITWTSKTWTDAVDGILIHADQDGTLKAGAVDNAAVLAADVVTTAKILDANVTTAKIADSNVTTAKIADGAVTPAKLLAGTGTSWAWQSWTPTWANISFGTAATSSYRYVQTGKKISGEIHVKMGTAPSFGAGAIQFTLPITAIARYGTQRFSSIGTGLLHDAGTGVFSCVVFLDNSTGTAGIRWNSVAGSAVQPAEFTSTSPFTLAASDDLSLTFVYEAA